MTLVEFLLASIAEDEAVARAAEAGPWRNADGNVYGGGDRSNEPIAVGPWSGDVGLSAEHIARHDPNRVLAECKAKRWIVERYQKIQGRTQDGDLDERLTLGWVLEQMAAPYADHPDYDEEWKR